jgi:hypothetical protein
LRFPHGAILNAHCTGRYAFADCCLKNQINERQECGIGPKRAFSGTKTHQARFKPEIVISRP